MVVDDDKDNPRKQFTRRDSPARNAPSFWAGLSEGSDAVEVLPWHCRSHLSWDRASEECVA